MENQESATNEEIQDFVDSHPEEPLETLVEEEDEGDGDDDNDDDDWIDEDEEETEEVAERRAQLYKQAAQIRRTHRKTEELDLPSTVMELDGPNGEKVYLVGTAHFSHESCDDVRKVISMVQPDAVVVELCSSRVQVLAYDEDYLTKISEESAMERLSKCIKQKGLISGLVLYMMLQMSSHITKQLGMAPGGEFRAALSEVKLVPGCQLLLGDRPIEITMQRMLASLSIWQKIKFAFLLLQELKPISAEDVEKLKERDMFEQLLSEMVVEFPHMANALVAERDIFLTGYLQKTMKMGVTLPDDSTHPAVIVGVVGIGHTGGIQKRFQEEITEEQMKEIQKIPKPSKVKQVLKFAAKGAVLGVVVYSVYRFIAWTGFYQTAVAFVPSF
uniref:TraB domain-containing protein n=1 Tax=Ciona intestinalis TaxID=7719 RepID=F7BK27_CIOIN|nr:traB domain-containing protein [Ciona intestinalis]|eukprot:XP_002127292.1 traB domain-containing protein [Ciona intestinalis]